MDVKIEKNGRSIRSSGREARDKKLSYKNSRECSMYGGIDTQLDMNMCKY